MTFLIHQIQHILPAGVEIMKLPHRLTSSSPGTQIPDNFQHPPVNLHNLLHNL